jgi:hypothetical protein
MALASSGIWMSACASSAIQSDGESSAVTWLNSATGRPVVVCVPVNDRLIQACTAPASPGAPVSDRCDGARLLERELQAYRACEAYANGAMSAEDYKASVQPIKK